MATIWLGIGFFGQAMFFMRFFVQWIVSERSKRSIIPNAFWYFSLAGGVILTTLTDVMGFLSFLGLATLILLH